LRLISNRNEDPKIVMICDRGELKLWLPRGATSSASRNKENAGLSSKLEIALEEKIALGIILQTLNLVEDLRSGDKVLKEVLKAKAEAKRQSGVTLRGHDHLQEVLTRVIGHHRVSFTYRVSVVRVRAVQTGIPPCAGFIKVETVLRVRIASFCTLSLPALPRVTPSLPLLLLLLLIPHERIRKIRKIRINQELSWKFLSRAESEPRDSFFSRWG
jgi:hypothetical protein